MARRHRSLLRRTATLGVLLALAAVPYALSSLEGGAPPATTGRTEAGSCAAMRSTPAGR